MRYPHRFGLDIRNLYRYDSNMSTVKVSPKYQVVIPKEVREALGVRPGDAIEVFLLENRIELVPQKNMREMRGFLSGIDTTVPRDADRL